MLAKAIRNRPVKQADPDHFRARLDYICGKATQVAVINMAGDWPDAKKQMTAAASLTPRLHYPAYHLVLSWAETENPTDAEMITAANTVLTDIGAAEYQCVLATHRDRIDPHIHAVINRAHPMGGQVLSVSHDYARLEAACRRVEHRMGWPQDRGRFDMQVDGDEVLLVPKPAQHWLCRSEARAEGRRVDGQGLRNERRGSGRPSLRQSLTDKAVAWLRGALVQSIGWAEAQNACRRIGLRYIRHAAGARILRPADGAHMPAGQLGTDCSYAKMTARLGPFRDDGVDRQINEVHDKKAPTGDITMPSPFDPDAFVRINGDAAHRALKMLRATLEQERQLISAALQGHRSLAAQAVRKVLRDRERMVRDMHRHRLRTDKIAIQADSPPAPLPTGQQAQFAMPGWEGNIHDHTSARQAWISATRAGRGHLDIGFANVLAADPDTIRITHWPRVLLAHRDRYKNLVGVQQVDLAIGQDLGIAAGGRAAICTLGSVDAMSCVVTADARVAILAANALKSRSRIWIVKPADLRADEVKHLQEALRGRTAWILHLPDSDPNDMMALSQILPDMAVTCITDDARVDRAVPSEDPDGSCRMTSICIMMSGADAGQAGTLRDATTGGQSSSSSSGYGTTFT